ncbi:hypothetical protein [uncultured Wocania sp.]|uniref:hypothetical protein n=1 Tax=uncultured Wocania sp. TaxID=2834404 RepID=UPI0030F5A6BC
MGINEKYEQILQPDELIKSFNTMVCFENWCKEGSVLDLTEALNVFEVFELYEYCEVIKKVIDLKNA